MIQLPSWLTGEKITALKTAAEHWWTLVRSWMDWPLTQFDPETCTIGVLHLMIFLIKQLKI